MCIPRSNKSLVGLVKGQAGFTLIELLVATLVASVIIVAAFHIHATFQAALHRQEQVSQMQQTLQVTKRLLVRAIRSSGGNMPGNLWSGCGGSHRIAAFMFHNSNRFGRTDRWDGGADPDPDWFEVLIPDQNASSRLRWNSFPFAFFRVFDSSTYRREDLILVQNASGGCLLQASHVWHWWGSHWVVAWPVGTRLAWCYNRFSFQLGACRHNALAGKLLPANSPVLNLRNSVAFRVDTTDPRRPLLMMAAGQAGGDPRRYQWQPVAEGVEDLQIAVHLDTSDPPDGRGDIWVNSRDLRTNELDRVREVRLSLVVRSTSPVTGWTSGRRPALEDRRQGPQDGYVRRTITTVVQLRNLPLVETSP